MPLKPRVVVCTLFGASAVGVALTWFGTGVSIAVPAASWAAIVSLGTLLTTGILWATYPSKPGRPPEWLARRWSRVGTLAVAGAVAGLAIRAVHAVTAVGPSLATGVGLAAGTVSVAAIAAAGRQFDSPFRPQAVALVAGTAAGGGLLAIAWLDVGTRGGSLTATAVRSVHLVAAGAWIGGAVWHNTVVVPALAADGDAGIRPVVRQFRRAVPLFVAAVAVSGLHQAVTLLGANPEAYVATALGRLVALKIAALALLSGLVVHGLARSRSADPPDH
ncbi:hypothetical protein [Halosimplex halobium]|uniref:hypothetical protein n=1 Tax=Halosimplex halobium TaxID=3396618 RepID=UPI003F546DD8